MEMDGFQWRLEAEDQTHGKENGMRDRTEKMIGGVSVLLLLFMVTRWKLFEYAALILWIVHLGSYLRRERKVNPVTIWYAVLGAALIGLFIWDILYYNKVLQ